MREDEVSVRTSDGEMDSFVCYPEEGGPFPAVILYMDAPGIREELRDMARRIGTVGYFVILPNLYYQVGREGDYGFDLARIRTDDAELQNMFAVMRSLSNAAVVGDTGPLLDYIRSHDQAAAGPIGCVGYCMSGQFVVSAAAAYPQDFAAIASFYGVGLITDAEDSPHLALNQVSGELYLAFAEEDIHVPQPIVDALPALLQAADVEHRIEVYPGTDHGFAFPHRPAYVKEAAERHWERLFALYDCCLRA